MNQYNICALEIDERNNTINVYLKELDEKLMAKITEIAGIPDIVFKQM